MSHLRKLNAWEQAGYDQSNNLQVLPVKQQTTFYLVAGNGLEIKVDDPSLVALRASDSDDKGAHKSAGLTAWEKDQFIRKIVVSAKTDEGSTKLRAQLNGSDWVEPLTIRVVRDQNWRQIGKTTGEAFVDIRKQLQALPLRDAVLRVAEDQMHSGVCCRSDGFGVYNVDASYNWCGAFAYWCWNQASAIKGQENPFGANNDVLLSPQKAINWAMREDTPGQLLRYKGMNPMTGKGTQEYRDIGWGGHNLQRGDIVLLREGHAGGWNHVCMVNQVDGTSIETMDGNQGKFQSIKRVKRSLADKLPDGSTKLVFVHILL